MSTHQSTQTVSNQTTGNQSTSNQSSSGLDDPRALFDRSAGQLLALVEKVRPEHHPLPTGATDFDVAALLGHALAVFDRVQLTLTTGTFEGSAVHRDSTDFAADILEAWNATRDVLADEAVLTRDVTLPWGPGTGASAVASWADEFVVHAWDLSLPLGLTADLDPTLADPALARYRLKLPAGPRPDWMPFADEVPVPDDASPYDRLVAFTGRTP